MIRRRPSNNQLIVLAATAIVVFVASVICSVEGWSPSPLSTTIASAARRIQVPLIVSNGQQNQQQLDPLRNADMKSKETIRSTNSNNTTIVTSTTSTSSSTQLRRSNVLSSSARATARRLATSTELRTVAAVCAGTLLTFTLNNLGPVPMAQVRACSISGLAAALILPERLASAALCGSYAGMAKLSVIPTLPEALLLGIVCASVLEVFNRNDVLTGVGGRLGFIAQTACTLQFIATNIVRSTPFLTTQGGTVAAALVGPFPKPFSKVMSQLPLVCLYTVLGSLFMTIWRESMDGQIVKHRTHKRSATSNPSSSSSDDVAIQLYKRLSTPVAAVSATGLVASLFPALTGPAFCGGVIAMSTTLRLKTYGDLIGAAAMGGVYQQAMTSLLLGGWGGRLGTFGLFGVMSYRALVRAWRVTIISIWKRRKSSGSDSGSSTASSAPTTSLFAATKAA